MKTLLLVAAAAVALGFAYRTTRPLEGTSWEVKTKADSFFSLSRRDTLIFKDGCLTSARWAQEGFAPAGYDAAREEDKSATWGAALHHDRKGTVRWQGIARGDRMEGTLQWTAADGRTRRYRFQGARKDG
ncbi:MAG: hypothetical protein HY926_04065 [Elusimicrobia bacterium]|nr:hypothetical protein [Elusimicrobiota bacterium]